MDSVWSRELLCWELWFRTGFPVQAVLPLLAVESMTFRGRNAYAAMDAGSSKCENSNLIFSRHTNSFVVSSNISPLVKKVIHPPQDFNRTVPEGSKQTKCLERSNGWRPPWEERQSSPCVITWQIMTNASMDYLTGSLILFKIHNLVPVKHSNHPFARE